MKIELDLTPALVQELREVIDGLSIAQYPRLILAILPQLPLDNEFPADSPDNAVGSSDAADPVIPSKGSAAHFLTVAHGELEVIEP